MLSPNQVLLQRCYQEAAKSPDPSTQNGVLVVKRLDRDGYYLPPILTGYNDFVKGVQVTPEHLERPLKYFYCEHAERNLIYEAAKRGISLWGTVMACPWGSCTHCARAIVQSGIAVLVTHKQYIEKTVDRWNEEQEIARLILNGGGVNVISEDCDDLETGVKVLFDGEYWTP